MVGLIRIRRSDIEIGRPIRHSVYDEHGRLLLSAGMSITIPRYLDALLAQGAYFDRAEVELGRQAAPNAADEPSVFARVEKLLLDLTQIYAAFFREPARIDLQKRVRRLAGQLMTACGEDGDAALAALHLDQATPYRIHHQLLCAAVVELTAQTIGVPEADRLSLVCAALTHDLALSEADDALEKARPPLSFEQRARVREHPLRSVAILAGDCGVTDAVWLDAVAQHHERMDGSGYPLGVRGDGIGLGGRLLAIADVYAAMIRSRPYRGNAFFPQNVLRDLFAGQHKYVPELVQALVGSIGLMPPGSIVRLQSNEIGVVRARGGAAGPRVFAVYTPAGMPLLKPLERDIRSPAFAIAGKASLDECRAAEVVMRRLWTG